jgi:nucleoside-diphosphate-sugar epimerase
MKTFCIIDGQGGGIGSAVIRKLKERLGESVRIIGLGTNAIATAQMLKAGANNGASGENAIVHTSRDADLIIGPIGILIANAMLGEVTPRMAEAVASSPARKILLPLTQENIEVVGVAPMPLPHLIDELLTEHLPQQL